MNYSKGGGVSQEIVKNYGDIKAPTKKEPVLRSSFFYFSFVYFNFLAFFISLTTSS